VSAASSDEWLSAAVVDEAVLALRPDYSAVLMTVDGLTGGPSDETSEALLVEAERTASGLLAGAAPEQLRHVEQWREAYRSFGAKPQRTRPSVEALLRRVAPNGQGLPRIDRVTDVYNAISLAHVVPIGGEDRHAYAGPARLVRADGSEPFEIVKDGQPAVEHPEPGEVVWRDDRGITCRRWNWRQCTRTRITDATTSALFILDGLAAIGVAGLSAAADALRAGLLALSPHATVSRRLIAGSEPDGVTNASARISR
jgi:DNA/RNA-binding domain of Phe-tRNA-synthetase-like protein